MPTTACGPWAWRMTRDEIMAALTAYFAALGKTVDGDSRLFEHDIIDSLGMLDLVEHIEEGLGVCLDQSLLVIDNFETLGRVADTVAAASE